MVHRIAIATVALVVIGASSVGAQPVPDRPAGAQPPAVSRDDAAAYLDAGLAAVHSGLQLTADQEHLWPGFEKAFRDFENLRRERGNPPGNEDLMARLQRRADMLSRRGAALKALADAAAPLWQSLDDGQKRRFSVLARLYYFQNSAATIAAVTVAAGWDREGPAPAAISAADDLGSAVRDATITATDPGTAAHVDLAGAIRACVALVVLDARAIIATRASAIATTVILAANWPDSGRGFGGAYGRGRPGQYPDAGPRGGGPDFRTFEQSPADPDRTNGL